jgi:tetratricopeptide (TPR) repeat protein
MPEPITRPADQHCSTSLNSEHTTLVAQASRQAPEGTMSPERWQQVKQALQEVGALSAELREARLEGMAAADAVLASEVRSLLAAQEQAPTGFLNAPAGSAAAHASAPYGFEGRRLGPYQVVERVGVGGMGEVYRAVRADDEYLQEVAIKLVRTGRGLLFEGSRLRSERQILAGLEHPNIARLLDGGTTAEGIPYLVMELVAGLPITEYCNRNQLDVAARLRLFMEVCAAVQHAHRHMVVHRDLKPNNIFVTREGVPKLLDFGIAKILDPCEPEVGGDRTLNTTRLLTPQYASPEQLAGEAVTTSSDIYSLGVILYELLTGMRPYTIDARALGVTAAIFEVEPRRPSTLAQHAAAPGTGLPVKLRRQLRGDLDNIVLMALSRQPERRYSTVQQLAEDIRRHLQHLPVIARRSTLGYRLATFLARHRVAVAVSGAMVVLLLGGVIMTSWEAHIAQEALIRARDESRASDQVTDYLESLFDAISPERTGGKPIDPLTLVEQGQAKLAARASEHPLLRARLLAAVGSLHCKVGQSDKCRSDLEEALAVIKTSSGSDPVMIARMEYELGAAYNTAGRSDDALRLLQHALSVLELVRPPDRSRLAAVWYQIGWSYLLHRPKDAIGPLERSRRLLASPQGEDTPESASTLGALAIAYSQVSQWSDAIELAGKRVALIERSFGTNDVRYFVALNDYAEVACEAGRFEEAKNDWQQVIDGYGRFYGQGSDKYIDAEVSLADVLFRRDELQQSIWWFRQAVNDYRRQGALGREMHVGALSGLNQVLQEHGDYTAAEAAAHESYLVSQHVHGFSSASLALARYRWGHSLVYTGATKQALGLLEQPSDETRPRYQALQQLWLADCYREMGQVAAAAASYDEAIVLYRTATPSTQVLPSMAYEGKALLLAGEGRFAESVPLLRQAIEGYTMSHLLLEGPTIASTKVELAGSLFAIGKHAEARALIASAGPIVERELAPTHRARILLKRLKKDAARS